MDNQNPAQTPNIPNNQPAQSQPTTPSMPPTPPPQSTGETTPPPSQPQGSNNTNTTIAVLLLLFVYPIGLLYMWLATKWPKWVKLLVSLPVLLILVFIALVIFAATKLPARVPISITTPTAITATLTPVDSNSSNTIETSGWKTYTNTKLNYSIKYPPNWYTAELGYNAISKLDCTDFSDLPITPVPSQTLTAVITICKSDGDLVSVFELKNNPEAKLVNISQYQVYRGKNLSSSNSDDVFLNDPKGGSLVISGTYNDNKIFDQMLSTFKFIQ